MIEKELSYKVIGCCMAVHSGLGPGLLEQCYHNALYYELRKQVLKVKYNVPFVVEYEGNAVGEYFADLVVEAKIILEVKAVRQLSEAHIAQLINYLRISGCKLGFLVNFQGCQLEWKRITDKIIIRPIRKLELEEMIDSINNRNLHAEADFGIKEGNKIW